jgi:hypothetical protein
MFSSTKLPLNSMNDDKNSKRFLIDNKEHDLLKNLTCHDILDFQVYSITIFKLKSSSYKKLKKKHQQQRLE